MTAKAKAKGKAKRAASAKKPPAKRRRPPAPSKGGRRRMSDLPPEQQAELRHRLAEAKRGEDEAERMADAIVDILNRPDARRPTE